MWFAVVQDRVFSFRNTLRGALKVSACIKTVRHAPTLSVVSLAMERLLDSMAALSVLMPIAGFPSQRYFRVR